MFKIISDGSSAQSRPPHIQTAAADPDLWRQVIFQDHVGLSAESDEDLLGHFRSPRSVLLTLFNQIKPGEIKSLFQWWSGRKAAKLHVEHTSNSYKQLRDKTRKALRERRPPPSSSFTVARAARILQKGPGSRRWSRTSPTFNLFLVPLSTFP